MISEKESLQVVNVIGFLLFIAGATCLITALPSPFGLGFAGIVLMYMGRNIMASCIVDLKELKNGHH